MNYRAAETEGKPKGEGDRTHSDASTSPQTSKTTRSGKADAVAVLPGPAQRSTKALYKIIDTVLTFLSRCWIEFDIARKFEPKLNQL